MSSHMDMKLVRPSLAVGMAIALAATFLMVGAVGTVAADDAEAGTSWNCDDDTGGESQFQTSSEAQVTAGQNGVEYTAPDPVELAKLPPTYAYVIANIAQGTNDPCDQEQNADTTRDDYHEIHADSGQGAEAQFCYSEGNYEEEGSNPEPTVMTDSHHDEDGHPCEYR